MRKLIKELELSITNKMYWSALNTALLLPDICGALDSPNGQAKGGKYVAWFDKYVLPNYPDSINSWDFYNLRCATIHQGKLNHTNANYSKIIFQLPDNFGNTVHCTIFNNTVMNVSLEIFIEDVISGFEKWYNERSNVDFVAKNIENTVQYRENGLPPYLVGIPVLY
ncbi:hypothetical protein [Labilibaculum euxinus]